MKTFNKALMFIAVLLILGGLLLYQQHIRRPDAEPRNATVEFMNAVGRADLKSMQMSSTPAFYNEFIQHFGRAKLEAVQNTFQLIYRYGLPTWTNYRRRAEYLATQEYENLNLQIADLGRRRFLQLPLEERMGLIEDNARYGVFILQAGIEGLSAENKNKIEDIGKFRSPEGRSRFIESELFNVLPEQDQIALKNLSALSMNDTPEKLAFIDKYGMAYLSDSQKKEISGIQRSELDNPPLFMSKYGEGLSKAFLENLRLQWSLDSEPLYFPAQDSNGSLLRGTEAVCSLTAFPEGQKSNNVKEARPLKIILKKERFRWIVFGVQPNLYELY